MSITVRFFASIRERVGRAETRIDSNGISNVADVWTRVVEAPWQPHILVAVNMEYARADASVRDGDEVAFFPPVTGGSGQSSRAESVNSLGRISSLFFGR